MKIFRQGDVLVKEVNSLPFGLKKQANNVLVYGESTGHAHRLIGGDVLTKGDTMYLNLLKKGKVVHEEHNTIELPVGKYIVIRQREYQNKDMVRLVVD